MADVLMAVVALVVTWTVLGGAFVLIYRALRSMIRAEKRGDDNAPERGL